MIRFLFFNLGFFITTFVVSQKLEWKRIPAYRLARPNWGQFDSSLKNILTKSKNFPSFKGFNFINPYKSLSQSIGHELTYLPAARYYMPDLNTYTFENTEKFICFGCTSEYTSKFFKPFYFKN